MSKPKPINSIQTQVVQCDGRFFPQFSAEGLNFFPIGSACETMAEAVGECELFTARAECLADRGRVVWRSDE